MVLQQPEAVQAGEVLVRVPQKLFITQATAAASALCGQLVRDAALGDWQALLLQLLCERAAGAGSFWAPYVAVLDSQADHPLLWGEQQRQWLAGSPMALRLQERLQQVQQDTKTLVAAGANQLPVAQTWQADVGEALVTCESVAWGAAVLLSRAFSLDLSESDMPLLADMSSFGSWGEHGADTLTLVPWADMLQHSSDAGEGSVLRYDPEAAAALLTAHRTYQCGEQVHDSYGPLLSPCDLLLDYGFVDPSNDNHRYDVPTALVASPRGPRNAALLAALEHTHGPGAALALGPDGPDETGLTWLRAASARDAELVKAGWAMRAGPADVGAACRAMGRLASPSSRETEGQLLASLAARISASLAAYPSSLAQDEAELEQLQGEVASAVGGLGGEEDMAEGVWLRVQVLRALTSEKRALHGSATTVATWQAALERGVELAGVYAGVGNGQDAAL